MGRCLHQTWVVSRLLCGIWSCKRWFEISTCESEWIYTELKLCWIQIEALFSFETVDECFQKHSLDSWVRMMRFHRSRRWYWNSRINSWRCFVHLRCLWSPLTTSCEYVRYSGIVRTMPTYSIQHLGRWSRSLILRHCEDTAYAWYSTSGYLIWKSDTPALRGQCLRMVINLWMFDLEIYFVIFISVAYSWRLVIAVSELP